MDLELTNVINISVSQAQTGIGAYNTSNIALFTSEPFANSFGVLGYNIYLSPKQVGIDFGSASQTFAEANAIFSQQPNILTGGGYLVVIPFVEAIQHFALSLVPASGSFTLIYTEGTTASINWNDAASVIQTKVRVIFPSAVVTGSLASQSLSIDFQGVYGAVDLPTFGGPGLLDGSSAPVVITPTTTQIGETMAAAITRTQDLVQYFGIITMKILSQVDMLAAAAVVLPLNKIAFWVQKLSASIAPGGSLDLLRTGDFTNSRGLYYGSSDDASALIMMASYAGRGLSTDFSGSNTTSTMHLKDLLGVQPDPTMTQVLLNEAQAAGADTYISLQGVAKVFCSGKNSFFDQVYNLQWFIGALQVAGFNYLAESSTKIPQTENGMNGLKGAYRQVCEQAVTNQYSAPGQWNSATTFGNQNDFLLNIAQRGYYIFSVPIALQSQTDREARKAPLAQIALKEAGAIQSSSVIVNINA